MAQNAVPHVMSDYIGILRRRKAYLLIVLPAAVLLSIFIAYSLTPYYRASASIMLDPASVSPELVPTLSSYADQQFELVQRQVLTPDNLVSTLRDLDPFPDAPELSLREKAQQVVDNTEIERIDPVTFEVLQQSSAFTIHYLSADPQIAAQVAQRLSDLFLKYNRESRSERATSAYEFLLAQTRDVETRMAGVDRKIADFKQRHPGAMPDAQGYNQIAAERAAQYLFDIDAQIRRAEERRQLLDVQLSKLSPTLGSTTGNTQTELATLQTQLAEARVRYTPDHPDIKRLQRQIEVLASRAPADSDSRSIVPNNPDYISVQGQLESAERDIAALRSSAARERSRMQQLESGVAAAPRVERDFAELLRAKEVLDQQFNDLHDRLRQADIARNLESAQRGDRFTQIRAPRVPESPYSPNRIGIILLGIVLGAGIAVGLAAFAESSDPSVRSSRDLEQITDVPAIASIPVILNDRDRRRMLKLRMTYASALAVATMLVAFTVVTG